MPGRDRPHPYTRGYTFWAQVLSERIASQNYTEKAKDYYRALLAEMLKENVLTDVQQ